MNHTVLLTTFLVLLLLRRLSSPTVLLGTTCSPAQHHVLASSAEALSFICGCGHRAPAWDKFFTRSICRRQSARTYCRKGHLHRYLPMAAREFTRAARIILVGAPGVGKGTQAERLMQRFPQLSAVSSGDLLRNAVRNKTPLGEERQSITVLHVC